MKISVIIPIYNTIKYIGECLNSIISQTYEKLEIICVDDGSTDGTSKILDEYKKRDDRIKVIHQDNQGQAFARKRGLKESTGELISFIDSDDWIDTKMYEKMHHLLIENDVDAVCCGLYMVKENGKTVYGNGIEEGIYNKKVIYQYLYDIEHSKCFLNWAYSTYLVKREQIYPYVMLVNDDIEQGEDVAGIWSFLANVSRLYVSNIPYYYHRLRNDSSSHKENEDYLISIMKTYKLLKREFKKCEHRDELIKVLKYAMFDVIQNNTSFSKEQQPFFMFPYEELDRNQKIVLYGAGVVGKSYYRQLIENHYCEIVLWVDREFETIRTSMYPVNNPEEIKKVEYDYIVIAGVNIEESGRIRDILKLQYNVAEEKILICKPKRMSKFVFLE